LVWVSLRARVDFELPAQQPQLLPLELRQLEDELDELFDR
jgi:hypothetical protein